MPSPLGLSKREVSRNKGQSRAVDLTKSLGRSRCASLSLGRHVACAPGTVPNASGTNYPTVKLWVRPQKVTIPVIPCSGVRCAPTHRANGSSSRSLSERIARQWRTRWRAKSRFGSLTLLLENSRRADASGLPGSWPRGGRGPCRDELTARLAVILAEFRPWIHAPQPATAERVTSGR
jgi:hypothetical protein